LIHINPLAVLVFESASIAEFLSLRIGLSGAGLVLALSRVSKLPEQMKGNGTQNANVTAIKRRGRISPVAANYNRTRNTTATIAVL